MIIFDNIKDKSWTGKGLSLNDNEIILSGNANIFQTIKLLKGDYTLKILGKKRNGNGNCLLEIKSDSIIIAKESIVLNTNWTEYILNFNVTDDISCKLNIYRDQVSIGSILIGKIIIEKNKILEKNNLTFAKTESAIYDYKDSFFSKKIAFIIPYGIYGGAEVYLKEIINNFNNSSFKNYILYMSKNDLKYKLNNCEHIDIKSDDFFKGILKSENFDYIVYYNSLKIYNKLVSLKRDGEINSKLIEIYHSDFKWNDSLSSFSNREEIEKIIYVSKNIGTDITGNFKKSIVPIGVDIKKFMKTKNNSLKQALNVNGNLIGTVARLSPEKNIPYIYELSKKDPENYYIIIGDGPLFKSLSQNKPKNVSLLGFKSDVENYYSQFDAFLLTSKMEGTPISILEAMASYVPVFTFNVGNISSIISNNETGFFLTGNPEEDINIINSNFNNFNVINNAKNFVLQNHDIKNISNLFFEEIYSINKEVDFVDKNDIFLEGEYI